MKRVSSGSSVLNTYPANTEVLTPQQFLKLTESDKANISRTRVIPPRLGRPGFGRIFVQYRHPVYRVMRSRVTHER